MNGNKLMMDTNAVIAILNGKVRSDELLRGKKRLLPTVVCGELFYGAFNSGRQAHNLEQVEQFIKQSYVLQVDLETARIFGAIRASLKKQGKPIPDNDLWIASLAKQHAAPLATADAHFSAVEGLELVTW